MNEILNLDNTLCAFSEVFPPKEPETKFDKFLELVQAFSSGTLVGTIGQVLQTTIKTCGVVSTEKQRVQAVKYVTDAYEVKCRSEVEMKMLNVEAEKNKALTLYIERSFQREIDQIHKNHIYRMKELQTHKEIALYEIDRYAQIQLEEINKEYAKIIRKNEALCVVYREYLEAMRASGEQPSHLISELSKSYMNIVSRSIFDKSVKMSDVEAGLNQSLKLLEFLGSYNNYFLPFETFIEQRKKMEEC